MTTDMAGCLASGGAHTTPLGAHWTCPALRPATFSRTGVST